MSDTTTAQARQIGYTPAQLNARVEMATAAKDRRITELEAQVAQYKQDAERWRHLHKNSYDRPGATQFHVFEHTWEPHSQSGEPTEWRRRVRGPGLEAAVDTAITAGASHE